MIPGLAMLMMQQLMTSSGPSYSSSTPTAKEPNQLQPNETVMFIELNELNLDGTTDCKTINAAYIKFIEDCTYSLLSMETFKETGETVEATRITMFDGNCLFVANKAVDLLWKLRG